MLPFIVHLRKTDVSPPLAVTCLTYKVCRKIIQIYVWHILWIEGVSSDHQAHQHASLTGQFAVEGWEGDGKGLQGTQREAIIHGEDVLGHTPKLHHDVVLWKYMERKKVAHCVSARRKTAGMMYRCQGGWSGSSWWKPGWRVRGSWARMTESVRSMLGICSPGWPVCPCFCWHGGSGGSPAPAKRRNA